jgi:hypothetical protein
MFDEKLIIIALKRVEETETFPFHVLPVIHVCEDVKKEGSIQWDELLY